MEQVIQTFGIDAKLIIAQMINFGLLMAILTYFLYKPILRLLDERAEKISTGIKDAEAAAVALASAEAEKQTIVAAAHSEAGAVAARAKSHADESAAGIIAEAETKASHILKEAEVKGEEARARALKESEGEIAKLAILAAEKILRKEA